MIGLYFYKSGGKVPTSWRPKGSAEQVFAMLVPLPLVNGYRNTMKAGLLIGRGVAKCAGRHGMQENLPDGSLTPR